MFSISRSQRNENCRNGGVARNLILQSRWLCSGNTGCSYLFLNTTPSLLPRTPLHPFAAGITRWIPLWIEALMSCSSLSALPPLSLLIFQFFLSFCPPLAFILWPPHPHPTPSQSCAIRQLHQLYREVFGTCIGGVCVERFPERPLHVCSSRGGSVIGHLLSAKHIFPVDQNQQMISHFREHAHTHAHAHTHPRRHTCTLDRISPVRLLRSQCIFWFLGYCDLIYQTTEHCLRILNWK